MSARNLGALAVCLAALFSLGPILLKGEVPTFRDHEDFFIPLRAFTADSLRDGELPLWNPFNASGEPWLANPQTGVFYPPAWLVVLLPFEAGYVSFLVLHLALLGLGARRLYLLVGSDAAATLVSVALVVSGPVLSLLDVSNNLTTLAWTPWILARALGREPEVTDSILLALSFLGGEPLLAAVTWAAWISIRLVRQGPSGVWHIAWRLLMATGLAAAQLLPFAAMLAGSDRAAGLDPEVAFRHSMSITDWLAVIVSPAGVQPGIGRSQLFLPSIYVCPLIVLLSLLAAAGNGKRGARVGWVLALATAALLASGSQVPIVRWILETLQLVVSRYPVKLALFGFLALGALCVIGFDKLDRLSVRARISCGIVAAALFSIAHVVHRPEQTVIAATGLAVGLLWLAGFVALLWFSERMGNEARTLLVCVLLPVVAFESIAASRFLLDSGAWPGIQPWRSSVAEGYRVMRLEQLDAVRAGATHTRDRRAWMGGYLNLHSSVHDVSTPAPVIDRRYLQLHDLALTRAREDLLDMLSVRYLLTERDLSSFGYRVVSAYGGVAMYERPGASPMLWPDFSPRRVRDASEAFERLLTPGGADPRTSTLATGLEAEYPETVPADAYGKLHSLEYTRHSVRAEVEVSDPALLVLNQRVTDGWSVTVDGDPRHTVVANALFRGVEVARGRHVVEWIYRPKSVRVGIFVSLTAMFALALEWWRVRAIRKKMSRSFHSEHA